jgi:hypothetical protein
MPIQFDIEHYRQLYNCSNWFETGLWDPRSDDISSKMALKCNFKNVYCVELRDDWVDLGLDVFRQEIENGRYHLIKDDSANMHKYLNDNDFQNRTMFFLDAHVDHNNIRNYKFKCPLFEELNAIDKLSRKDNIILIDDLRIIKDLYPWGETTYGNINFLEKLKERILRINSNYKFSTLDGHVKDDVLLCTI